MILDTEMYSSQAALIRLRKVGSSGSGTSEGRSARMTLAQVASIHKSIVAI
jgi:hypothetical protein